MFPFLRPLALGLCAALIPAVSFAQAPEFYKGRTVNIYIGFSPGGTYDLFGRLVARHIGKHIPGNPTVVAQSMPGAGSFTLANWMYRIAPKDGTAMGIVAQTMAIEEMLKTPGVNYKAAEFNWIGRATSNVEITLVSSTAKAKTVEDAKTIETTLASTGAGSPGEGYPKLMNGTIGTRFKLVGPYPGSTDGLLAMERGETDGAFTSWNTLNVTKHDWLEQKKVNVLVQYALERLPDMKDVPTMVELAKTPEDKELFAFYVSGGEVGRSFLAPPGVPAERIAILRKAFAATVADADFLADAAKARVSVSASSGERLQEVVTRVHAAPKEVVARARQIIEP